MSRERLEQMRDRITSQVFGYWWGHRLVRTEKAEPHLDRALAAAWLGKGRLTQEMLPRAEQVPWGGNSVGVLHRAVRLQGGSVMLLQCLTKLLRDPEGSVRSVAAEAVGKLGGPAATPEILACLAELLGDQNEQNDEMRSVAGEAVAKLGGAATP
jgi:hypothetical protein